MSQKVKLAMFTLLLLSLFNVCYATDTVSGSKLDEIINVQKYFRSIHIMAMLLVGFGFAVIQKIDSCGVLYLHGLPGIFGGLVAMFFVFIPQH